MTSQETLLLCALPSRGLLGEERSCSPLKRAGSPTGQQNTASTLGQRGAGARDPYCSPSLTFLSLPVDPESQELARKCVTLGVGKSMSLGSKHRLCNLTAPSHLLTMGPQASQTFTEPQFPQLQMGKQLYPSHWVGPAIVTLKAL